MARTLAHGEARRVYDRIGRWQDRQGWYEDRALEALLRHGDFARARAVVELGCGTGQLAVRLLRDHLPAEATYLGLDVSDTMVRLAGERLQPWAGRAQVRRTAGDVALPEPAHRFDRYLATYVLDLLDEADMRTALAEAHRVLRPGGRLCLASLTEGRRGVARWVTALWRGVYGLNPRWVGGCRPIRLLDRLPGDRWRLLHHEVVSAWGISSEVVVAEPVKR